MPGNLKADAQMFLSSDSWDVTALKQALAEGADIDATDGTGQSLLSRSLEFHFPARGLYTDLVKRLVEYLTVANKAGLSLNVPDGLFKIIHISNPSILQLFISAGADLTCKNAEQETLLHRVAKTGGDSKAVFDTSLIEVLISAGVNVNSVDGQGNTALHYAVFEQAPNNVAKLLAAGANPNAAKGDGLTPYQLYWDNYSTSSSTEILMALLQYGADVDAPTGYNLESTGLMRAAAKAMPEHVRLLLAAGANPFGQNMRGTTALHLCGISTPSPEVTLCKQLLVAATSVEELRTGVRGTSVHKDAFENYPHAPKQNSAMKVF